MSRRPPGSRPPPLGRAPRAKTPIVPRDAGPARTLGSTGPRAEATAREPTELVAELVENFREQVRRAVQVELDDSVDSLAFVDHYLRLARDEQREPIIELIAAGAGAYFGDLVRRHLGAVWIGDGKDPRRLRLLMTCQFLFFSPVDQAFEAIAGESLEPDDPRHPSDGTILDTAFHLRPGSREDREDPDPSREDDADWLEDRLSELAPVPEDEFHSLTCRFETLKLMLELLATKQAFEGKQPVQLGVDDYMTAMSSAGSS